MSAVYVVSTGTANIASVLAGLSRAGAAPELTHDAERVRTAEAVVLPGVGAFAASLETLAEHGLVDALRERIRAGKRTLAVCVGLQLLASESEESPGARGLAIWPDTVRRFTGPVRIPQLGWNRITPSAGARWFRDGYVYFANSYRLEALPADHEGALSDHGGPFVAGVERGDLLACQFHPELSGAFGAELLARWVRGRP